ncbi:MAG: hypothetical protein ACLFM8_03815 [Halobacteriales archaeon]
MAGDPLLFATLIATGLGGAVLVAIAAAALRRRRTAAYALVTLALAALITRAVLGGLALAGHVDDPFHHRFEHLIDGAMIGLLLSAIYLARRGGTTQTDHAPRKP